jgi:hypothetical protein
MHALQEGHVVDIGCAHGASKGQNLCVCQGDMYLGSHNSTCTSSVLPHAHSHNQGQHLTPLPK